MSILTSEDKPLFTRKREFFTWMAVSGEVTLLMTTPIHSTCMAQLSSIRYDFFRGILKHPLYSKKVFGAFIIPIILESHRSPKTLMDLLPWVDRRK